MMKNDKLNELLGALCNESLTEVQHQRLCEVLAADPRARQTYFEYLEIHLKLAQWAGTEGHSLPLTQLKQSLDRMLPSQQIIDRRSNRVRSWIQLGIALAATVLITLFARQALLQDNLENGQRASVDTKSFDSMDHNIQGAAYMATLARSADCVWEGTHRPRFEGQRLLSQELRLEKGVAEFRLETGVLLVLEGPARMTINSNHSATLEQGRVVLHGDEMAKEFALHTPEAVLFDEGTEYGAYVDPLGATEVHVFEGRVRIEAHEDSRSETVQAHEILSGGSASRLDVHGSQAVPLANKMFVRRIPASALPRVSSANDLLALENFDYPGPDLGNANGGTGWAKPWQLSINEPGPPGASILSEESLSTTAYSHIGKGGCFLQDGIGRSSRQLATPLRMDTDAVYYMSFLFKKSRGAPPGVTQYGSVSFRSSDPSRFSDDRILFGMSSENYIIMGHDDQQVLNAPQLLTGETYFYVAKIVAGKTDPDQVLLRVFSPHERVDNSEPLSWNCVSRPHDNDTIYTNFFIYVGGDAAFQVDEVRIGSTWKSVTESK